MLANVDCKDWKELASVQDATCKVLERNTNTVSWLRLVAFGIAAGLVVAGSIGNAAVLYWLSLPFLLGFAFLVVYHRKMEQKLSRKRNLFYIYSRYGRRMDNTWREEQFVPVDEMDTPLTQKEKDLDLYGPGSLYQYLCVAETWGGRKRLRELLDQDVPGYDEVCRRQQATKAIMEQPDFILRFLLALRRLEGKKGVSTKASAEAFIQEAEHTVVSNVIILWGRRILAWMLPVVTIAGFFLSIPLGIGFCVLQFLCGLVGHAVFGNRLKAVFSFHRFIAAYEELFDLLECQAAKAAFKQLSGICACVQFRQNPLGYFLASSFLMWDFHCVDAWDRWKRQYGTYVTYWLSRIYETEAQLSLLTLAQVRTQVTYPTVLCEDAPYLQGTQLVHPLIPEDKGVANDFEAKSGLFIITGSNMSGKTTFMRTLGVNLALMYAGGPVCGTALQSTIMQIRTSMRIADQIGEGLSTFYAEVLRIRDIVAFADQNQPMLALIDEIYKGTNAQDRATCAVATARRLAKEHTVVMMTTHDQELCKLSQSMEGVANYHFTEHYEDDRLLFDYKIRSGEAQGSNACHLLRLAGIM